MVRVPSTDMTWLGHFSSACRTGADSTFFFMATPPTAFYTLSLHDALPIYHVTRHERRHVGAPARDLAQRPHEFRRGRSEGTRLNSSHGYISYAVFCLKKKTTPTSLSINPAPPRAIAVAGAPPLALHPTDRR